MSDNLYPYLQAPLVFQRVFCLCILLLLASAGETFAYDSLLRRSFTTAPQAATSG